MCRSAFTKATLLYAGHGSGAKYFSHEQMLSMNQSPIGFLMGCSSVRGGESEINIRRVETPLYYLMLGSQAVVGE